MPISIKAIKAVIKNQDDKVLILQRNPEIRDSDCWDLPGGLLEENENEESALRREAEEELGVKINIIKKDKTWSFFRSQDSATVEVQNYICKIKEGKIILSDEHIDFKWVDMSEIKNYSVKDESLYAALK